MMQLAQLKEALSGQGVMISFTGAFHHSIIEELGKAVRHYLESDAAAMTSMMDVFSVYIEQAQNVRQYTNAMEDDAVAHSGIVVIGKQEGRYVVSSGNLVVREDGEALVRRIDELKGLDRQALRKAYKTQMKAPRAEGSDAAGLGLIDMARKASAPLACNLDPQENGYSFFTLQVEI